MANADTQNFSQPFYSGVFTYLIERKRVTNQDTKVMFVQIYIINLMGRTVNSNQNFLFFCTVIDD